MRHEVFEQDQAIEAGDAATEPSGVRLPHLRATGFFLTAATRHSMEKAAQDRRMSRVTFEVHDGGLEEAIRRCATGPSPEILMVEAHARPDALLNELDRLAEVCLPSTQVVVIGSDNDVMLFRTLMDRGVADYLVSPSDPREIVSVFQGLVATKTRTQAGRVHAFIGACGGVGSSTVAQDFAFTLAQKTGTPTLLADLDIRFGSAAMNLDLRRSAGLEKYLAAPAKLDAALLDRLLVRRGKTLSVLASPMEPLGDYRADAGLMEQLVGIARESFPQIVLDLPHEWSTWTKEALSVADEVILVAAPDLVSFQNTKLMVEALKSLRPNDALPRLVLNGCRVPKRREIKPASFAKGVGLPEVTRIDFDARLFSAALAEGLTLCEKQPRGSAQKEIDRLVQSLSPQLPRRRSSLGARLLGHLRAMGSLRS